MSKNQEFSVDGGDRSRAPVQVEKNSFRLLSDKLAVTARGVRESVAAGEVSTMAERVGRFFRETGGGARVVVGAVPFDRMAADFLFQPETIDLGADARRGAGAYRTAATSGARWLVAPAPDAAAYSEAVRACLARMNDPELRKVVLSRSLLATAGSPIDVDGVFHNLSADGSVTAFMTQLSSEPSAPRVLVGATPELLVSKSGREVLSHPLAGSAARLADPVADRNAVAALKDSDKDRREHRAVVEAVLDGLNPYCAELAAPDPEALVATATMWHLGTRIVGRLKDAATPVAELVAALHPTPAVCGLPRERAAEVIRELESYDRGFYAGAVGWADESGDGQWFVSLRCAEIAGSRARLYAGAGIVPGSDPVGEAEETSAKFLAMLKALGVDEQGRAMAGKAA